MRSIRIATSTSLLTGRGAKRRGIPAGRRPLAQTTDGFLWIGTDIGLFRFDGVHFERYVPRSGDQLSEEPVRGLRALPDGSLWIAYRTLENKICVLRNGNVKCYGKADGVTSNPTAIVQDHEGTIWANTELESYASTVRDGNASVRIGTSRKMCHASLQYVLFVDSRGTLWAGVNHTDSVSQTGIEAI